MAGSTLPVRYHLQMTLLKEREKKACYTERFGSLAGELHGGRGWGLAWDESMDALGWMMRCDQATYLPDCLMVKVDIASMANSLEVRSPLLDHELVEFSASIPSGWKVDGEESKSILKDVARRLLPREVLRKPKSGFGIPLAQWFRGESSGLLRQVLLDDTARRRGLFRTAFLRRMIDEHVGGRRDWSNRLWAFLFLELWFREYID